MERLPSFPDPPERLPSFDDPPEPNRLSSFMLLLAIAASLAIVPAAVALGGTAAGRTFFGAMLAFAAYGVAREVSAVVLHTRYTLMDLWLGVMLCGSAAGGIFAGIGTLIENLNDPDARRLLWHMSACGALVAIWFILRGLYHGLRLAMWLKTERTGERMRMLLLGLLGYVAHFALMLCPYPILLLFISIMSPSNRRPAPILTMVFVVALIGGLYYITRAHLRYRKRAQENFEANPEALGKAGRLVPEGGRAGLMRVLGNAVGFVMRLLGGGRG